MAIEPGPVIRNKKGQFQLGSPRIPSSGIKKRTIPQYREAFRQVVTPEEVVEVAKSLVFLAVNKRHFKACELLLKYTIGQPPKDTDSPEEIPDEFNELFDGLDISDLEALAENAKE